MNTGETDAVMQCGDVSGDGRVAINDVILVRDFVAGKVDSLLPVEYGLQVADVDLNDSTLIRSYVL